MNPLIRLAVVDDHHLFRKGLISLLKEFTGFEVVIEAANGLELLEQLKSKAVDVVLLDLQMPVMDGFETTEVLQEEYRHIKILILSMHTGNDYITHLINKGVQGFLLKDQEIESISDAIHSVNENGYYFNELVSHDTVRGLITNKKIFPTFNYVNLTEREIEVIQLICREYNNREISEKLFVSIRTVEGHRERILMKTNAKNVVGIVMYAVKHNLLDLYIENNQAKAM